MAGSILSKLKDAFPELILDDAEKDRTPQSWTQTISRGGLTITSCKMLLLMKEWNNYFITFHENKGGKWMYNHSLGIIQVLGTRICEDYPEQYHEIIRTYTRIRTFFRIRYLNRKIDQTKLRQRNFWKKRQFSKSGAPNFDDSLVENDNMSIY